MAKAEQAEKARAADAATAELRAQVATQSAALQEMQEQLNCIRASREADERAQAAGREEVKAVQAEVVVLTQQVTHCREQASSSRAAAEALSSDLTKTSADVAAISQVAKAQEQVQALMVQQQSDQVRTLACGRPARPCFTLLMSVSFQTALQACISDEIRVALLAKGHC